MLDIFGGSEGETDKRKQIRIICGAMRFMHRAPCRWFDSTLGHQYTKVYRKDLSEETNKTQGFSVNPNSIPEGILQKMLVIF